MNILHCTLIFHVMGYPRDRRPAVSRLGLSTYSSRMWPDSMPSLMRSKLPKPIRHCAVFRAIRSEDRRDSDAYRLKSRKPFNNLLQ